MFTPMQNPNTFAALAFLSGSSPDREGRMIDDYLAFSAERWEECHNHVQWAFPSNIPSMFNVNAPIIDFDEFMRHTFVDGMPVSSSTETIYEHLGELIEGYFNSLGVGLTDAGSVFLMRIHHPERLNWLYSTRDHNFRRLTRLFMLWYHVKEPLMLYSNNRFVKNFETIYHFISSMIRSSWDSPEITETLTYWDRAFHQGTN